METLLETQSFPLIVGYSLKSCRVVHLIKLYPKNLNIRVWGPFNHIDKDSILTHSKFFSTQFKSLTEPDNLPIKDDNYTITERKSSPTFLMNFFFFFVFMSTHASADSAKAYESFLVPTKIFSRIIFSWLHLISLHAWIFG